MFKKFAVNTISSLIISILIGFVFTFLGVFINDLFGSFSFVGLIVLFCALFGFGYFVGCQLHYTKKIGLLSLVVVPMIILVALYCLFMVAIPVVSTIIQYPGAAWLESLNIKADAYPALFYAVAFAHYLIYSFSMFIGAYKKRS